MHCSIYPNSILDAAIFTRTTYILAASGGYWMNAAAASG